MSTTAEQRRKDDRIWLYVALAFAVFWGLYLVIFNPGAPSDAPKLAGTGLSLPADYGWTATDMKGETVDFSRFKGRAVFLNFWATWCGPCLSEMPSIVRLASDPSLKGKVDFVCVASDNRREVVAKFVSEKNWPMTILHAQAVPDVFLTDGIPATFLIDPQGRIVATEVGAAVWDSPEVVAFLRNMAEAKK